jgi:hypothetical protein
MPAEIQLRRPLKSGEQIIGAIRLRAPTLKDINELGDLAEHIVLAGGTYFDHVHWDRVSELIQRCVTAPANAPAWIGGVGIDDTYQLIRAIGRFWRASKNAAANMPGLPSNQQTTKGS